MSIGTHRNRYAYLWVVQVNYGFGDGWEDCAASEDRSEARADLRAYRENCPEYPARIIQRREPV